MSKSGLGQVFYGSEEVTRARDVAFDVVSGRRVGRRTGIVYDLRVLRCHPPDVVLLAARAFETAVLTAYVQLA